MTLKLNGSSSGSVALDAPASTTSGADITFKLPVADGTAGQVLQTDGSGNWSWVSLPAASVAYSEYDEWRLTSSQSCTSNDNAYITSNWERNDVGFDKIGTGMTESSGEFSFPSTGKWLIFYHIQFYGVNSARAIRADLFTTTDNSSYSAVGHSTSHLSDRGTNQAGYGEVNLQYFFDVTSTTNCKVKLGGMSYSGSNASFNGNTSQNSTYVTFTKIGAT